MANVLAASAALTSIVLILYLAYDILVRRRPLLSYRNLFLVGFIFFYGTSTVLMIALDLTGIYAPSGAGYGPLAALIPVFAIAFLLADRYGGKWTWLGKLIPKVQYPATTPGLLLGAFALLAIALVGLLPPTNYFTGILMQFRPGAAAAATALATYFLLAKKLNPFAWIIWGGIFMLSALISVAGGTDRRFVLGVILAALWVWYYTVLRHRWVWGTVGKMAVVVVGVLFFIILYSGIRHVGDTEMSFGRRAGQFVEAAKDPTSVRKGSVETVFLQDAPTNTLYIIENYPDNYDLDPFNGLIFYVGNPIPRFIWPDKPVGLGYSLQQQFNIDANLGPGIIGHGWAEGMWIGVIGYAVFFGLLCGLFDRLALMQANNPYFVAVFGSSLGNVIGLPRGETSLFLVLITTAAVGTFLILWSMKLFFGPFFRATAPLVIPAPVSRDLQYEEAEADWSDTYEPLTDLELAAAYGDDDR